MKTHCFRFNFSQLRSFCILVALASTPMLAQAEQPDFSIGSSLLQNELRDQTFQTLFINKMYLGGLELSDFRFVISSEGLLCPQRIMLEKGPFEFFSNQINNAGCLNLIDLEASSQSSTSFKSENNLIIAEYRGTPEVPGKKFNLLATRLGQAVNFDSGESMVIELKVAGKTRIRQFFDVWVSGETQFKIRIQKDLVRHAWNIAFGRVREDKSVHWTPFTLVKSTIDKSSLFSSGVSLAFTRAGIVTKPLIISAAKVQFE